MSGFDVQAYAGLFARVLHLAFPGRKAKDLSVLDYGCGAGRLLSAAKHYGFGTVVGFDLADVMAREAERVSGVPVLSNPRQLERNFDIVFSCDVIEHCQNPREDIEIIHSVLQPGGYFYCSTPTLAGLAGRVLGQAWWCAGPVDHIQLYSHGALIGGLREAGFQIVDVHAVKFIPWIEKAPENMPDRVLNYVYKFLVRCNRSDGGTLLQQQISKIVRRASLGDYLNVLARRLEPQIAEPPR